MRAHEFLNEAANPNLTQLKTQIIGQVKKTEDPDLLQKIFTVLNKTGLVDRIGLVLDRDTDTKGYVQQLVDMIIDVPGTYEEKIAFVKEYPNGYIDVDKMISGEYVKFDELIVGGKGTPIEFVHRVFDSLKQVTFGSAKGPGEFALAVLSPKIKITGKGDLNIGKDIIEVKAAAGSKGGRVGTPGLLRSHDIPKILAKYCKTPVPAGSSLNLKQLHNYLIANNLTKTQMTKCVKELFNYIFDNRVDVSDIVDAVLMGADPSPFYLRANYEVYQNESGFTGMMLMNFPAQSLRYFKDPIQMASQIYAFSVYLISSNPSFHSRQILSQVTLTPVKEPKESPVKGKKGGADQRRGMLGEPAVVNPPGPKKGTPKAKPTSVLQKNSNTTPGQQAPLQKSVIRPISSK